jgi:DNA-binding response OmpR family regulator
MQDQPAPEPQTPEQSVPIAEQPAPAAVPAATARKKILLVEDDIALAAVYRSRLELEDFEIYEVNNGEQALQAAKEFQPDLILLDAMMPKISGFDVLDILRHTPETANIRVIMLTALSQPKDKEKAEQLGVDDYLVKSQVVIGDVVERVRHHLGMDA